MPDATEPDSDTCVSARMGLEDCPAAEADQNPDRHGQGDAMADAAGFAERIGNRFVLRVIAGFGKRRSRLAMRFVSGHRHSSGRAFIGDSVRLLAHDTPESACCTCTCMSHRPTRTRPAHRRWLRCPGIHRMAPARWLRISRTSQPRRFHIHMLRIVVD